MKNNAMKCLTLYQPWASLMAFGEKKIETRSWGTSYRGPLLIHAAKKWNRDLYELAGSEPFRSALIRHLSFGGPPGTRECCDCCASSWAITAGEFGAMAAIAGSAAEAAKTFGFHVRPDWNLTGMGMPGMGAHAVNCSKLFAMLPNPLPLGKIVGVVTLYDCRQVTPDDPPNDFATNEQHFGDLTPGRYAWMTSGAVRFKEPIPFQGRQGLYDVPERLVRNAI